MRFGCVSRVLVARIQSQVVAGRLASVNVLRNAEKGLSMLACQIRNIETYPLIFAYFVRP